jgi:LmbE family N-acetylglucosaminyl deacetylase
VTHRVVQVMVAWATMALAGSGQALAALQEPERTPVSGAQILADIDALGVAGAVLYVAAHPDDENTRFLAWLARQRHLDTAYVSLTRGEGGQNLIGREREHALGRIRTFELLAARRIDGTRQFFTRALDFGYSKTAAETLSVWGREPILHDLVRVIRTHRPDIIVARFSTQPPNHGHHTASAILAAEAFALAADPAHVDGLPPHQARHLFENKSHWRFAPNQDLSQYIQLDVNTYDPLSGMSPAEVAARSRSQHKSQGFGTAPAFGTTLEYFEHLQSAPGIAAPTGLFDGLDTSWRRFPGTDVVIRAHEALVRGFDGRAPGASAQALVAFVDAVSALPLNGAIGHARARALDRAGRILMHMAGLVIELRTPVAVATPSQSLLLELEAVARTASPAVRIDAIVGPDGHRSAVDRTLAPGQPLKVPHPLIIDPAFDLLATAPGLPPRTPDHAIAADPRPLVTVGIALALAGRSFQLNLTPTFVSVDPVDGERRVPLDLAPPVSVTPEVAPDGALPVVNGAPASLEYTVAAHGAARKGTLRPRPPAGFAVAPTELPFELLDGAATKLTFQLRPASGAAPRNDHRAVVETDVLLDGQTTPAIRRDVIRHAHLPPLSLHGPARITISSFALKAGRTRRIGYIPGADDEVMLALQRAGYEVATVDPANDTLDGFDAIVVGIRALNVQPQLEQHVERLLQFAEKGGRLVWQYNVSSRFRPLGKVRMGPAPLEIAQDRVTDERAVMTPIPGPDGRPHPVLLQPNPIGPADGEGWVQERGIYFASTWAAPWAPVLRMNDPDEPAVDGALLVAPHGRGAVIYTGLAFFRQLPAGVPGAFRLFANLVARTEVRR